jgi:hypothetical protein
MLVMWASSTISQMPEKPAMKSLVRGGVGSGGPGLRQGVSQAASRERLTAAGAVTVRYRRMATM